MMPPKELLQDEFELFFELIDLFRTIFAEFVIIEFEKI